MNERSQLRTACGKNIPDGTAGAKTWAHLWRLLGVSEGHAGLVQRSGEWVGGGSAAGEAGRTRSQARSWPGSPLHLESQREPLKGLEPKSEGTALCFSLCRKWTEWVWDGGSGRLSKAPRCRDFPVVGWLRTGFQCRRHRFSPWLGKKIHAPGATKPSAPEHLIEDPAQEEKKKAPK